MENFLRDLAVAQREQGLEVQVLSHQHESFRRPAREVLEGVEVVRTPILGRFFYAPVAPLFDLHLRRALAGGRIEVVHAHVPNLSAFWLLAHRRTPPIVVHWHADFVASKIDRKMSLFYPPYRVLEQALLARAARIVATSDQYLAASGPLAPFRDKCAVAPLGMALDRLRRPGPDEAEAVRRRYGGRPLVLSVGRFTYYKGFSFLVEAARRVEGASFVLAGDGPLRPGIEARVRELGLQDRVFLPGFISDRDLQAHLAACDVFCLASIERTEAFGLVLVEAQAYAKPLVTTSIPGSGVAFVNQEGVTGLSVPPGDAPALASALSRLLADPELRRDMGERGAARARELFDIRSVARRISDVYRAL
jgi:rhamnosyl/mannosyltransferase